MKLLPRYALSSGLKIGTQYLMEQFFPLPFTRYITLHASSGMAGKNYPYYPLVVELIKPYLAKQGIEIVQIGAKDDPGIAGCYHTMGRDNIWRGSYIVRNSMLHLCNDSVWAHRAGYLGIPLVELFATTSEANHAPYQYNTAKTRFISSHRWNKQPTFAAQESPSTATLICPFAVARAVLELLEIPHTVTQRTVHVGPSYHASLLEWIPNVSVSPQFNPDAPLVVRYDLCQNEGMLIQTLQTGRKVNLLTKTPLNLQILAAFKASILTYGHEVDETLPLEYAAAVKKLFPAATFFTRDPDPVKLAALRFKLFDVVQVQHVVDKTRDEFIKSMREYLNDPAFSLDFADKSHRLEFRTNKYILSNGKIYTSHAHEKADIPVGADGANAVRDEDVWYHDMNHWLVYMT